jgi:predicted HNH restriction endonuclease
MFNPSYVLPVILLWLGQQKTLLPPAFEETIDDVERDESFSVEDGILKVRSHLSRERNRELVRLAKDAFQFAHKGKLFCEVCGFDFGPVYGAPDFIEAHHRVPLRDLQPGTLTKISDLAMVCANCHRMLHRGPQWMTIPELRTKMRRLVEKQSPELGHV